MTATKTAAKKTARKTAKRPAKRAAKKPAKRAARRSPKTDLIPVMRATGKPRGRPPKIDQPSLCDPTKTVGVAIVDLVAEGLPPDVAAPMAGIHPQTLTTWLKWGAEEITRLVSAESPDEPVDETRAPFVAVTEELALADAMSRGATLMTLKRLGERNHPALLAYLAARWPDHYGQRPTRLEVTGAAGGPVRTAITLPTIDQAELAVARIEAAHAQQLALTQRSAIDVQEVAS